jgi:hypothetical protein
LDNWLAEVVSPARLYEKNNTGMANNRATTVAYANQKTQTHESSSFRKNENLTNDFHWVENYDSRASFSPTIATYASRPFFSKYTPSHRKIKANTDQEN